MACSTCGRKYRPVQAIPGMEVTKVNISSSEVISVPTPPTVPPVSTPPKTGVKVSTGLYVITVPKT